ncbi:MAG: SMC-Scp complex subunit ScpB [Limnochordales bacterium]|nr:SMC-Scp complex subunit ScpB [Limnochordales bacterium]
MQEKEAGGELRETVRQEPLPPFRVDWGALEALLFATDEPLSLERLSYILGVPAETVRVELERWWADRSARPHGVELQEVAGGYRLATAPQYRDLVAKVHVVPDRTGLSRAALETLAIIAYRQPISRPEIDQLRGVRSESAINSLLERGLIEEAGRADTIGHPVLYRTTRRFLLEFGLRSLADLPPVKIDGEAEASQTEVKAEGEAEGEATDRLRAGHKPRSQLRPQPRFRPQSRSQSQSQSQSEP